MHGKQGWERMKIFSFRFFSDVSGATAVEYGLLAGLISVAMISGLSNFSDELLIVFETITAAMQGAGT
ncbi:Flp family type IVb pilin [Pararhizobium gei]|uniref:Flp family type IVb pilin n=1 Tax=Pararhizobium gei TaxID=1395951 RepID=UPI003D9C7428